MRSWELVDLFEVSSKVPYRIGYISIFSPIPVFNLEVVTTPRFTMRPGPEKYLVLVAAVIPLAPEDSQREFELKRIVRTGIHNQKALQGAVFC